MEIPMKRMNKYVLTSILTAASLLSPANTLYAANTSNITPASFAINASYDYSLVFDWEYYYNTYADLQQNIGKDADALFQHFLTTGMKEGRRGNDAFCLKAYMYNNPDLLSIYGAEDLSSYYIHYMTCGKMEGRKAVFAPGSAFPEGTLAGYTTSYDTTEARAVNVELAAARINGIVIEPGQTFSFSNSIGTRTTTNGYVTAPSYAAGRVVTSVGGGICQVSSTLYISMLLSGIPAVEHYFHSLPVDYVPAGLDAAIVENYKDLRFVNPYDFPIMIEATTANGKLTVNLIKAVI